MVLRKGKINIPHFAHQSLKECDPWYEPKCEWHIANQNLFKPECREVPIYEDGKRHIADIFVKKYNVVVEFQHSPITKDEFDERNEFYTKNGRRIIWVFDFSDKNTIDQYAASNYNNDFKKFSWRHRCKFMENVDKNNSIDVVFFIKPPPDAPLYLDGYEWLDGYLHVTWFVNNFRYFGGYADKYYGGYTQMLSKLIMNRR